MRADYKRDLKQYLIDLDEKFFCEYDDVELMQTTTIRKDIEKNLPLFTFKELEDIKKADKKVFEYMKKYPDKPVYLVLENIAKIIENSALYKNKNQKKLQKLFRKVFTPFDKMTREQKIKFLYIDLESRNLADEKTIKKELEKDLKRVKKKNKIRLS